jgi:hypothetical protein
VSSSKNTQVPYKFDYVFLKALLFKGGRPNEIGLQIGRPQRTPDSRDAIGRLSEGTQASLQKETCIFSNSLPIASRLNGAHVTDSREAIGSLSVDQFVDQFVVIRCQP